MTARAVTTIDAPAAILGEGPLWSPRERSLYWVDIVGQRVFRYRPDGGRVDAVDLPYAPSALAPRSEEHTSELQSLMRISYAVFCLKNKQLIDNHLLCTKNSYTNIIT